MPRLLDTKTIVADPSIFYLSQTQADGGFKSINDLYFRAGFKCLRAADDTSELAGMERILEHWHALEHREPTLKIVCPARYDYSRKQFGLIRDGCPNLLWELKRARREQLTARQLMTKNPSEGIVDKDNHLRDCLKYIVHLVPKPSDVPVALKRDEIIAEAFRTGNHGSLAVRIAQLDHQQQRQSEPISYRAQWPRNDR